jgi:hypothetical protein
MSNTRIITSRDACIIKTKLGKVQVIVWPDESVAINALDKKDKKCKRLGHIRLSAKAICILSNFLYDTGWVKRIQQQQ